jgi:catechol 2,3-dioxygenase-like lactoylglutathione lyase family enzyme
MNDALGVTELQHVLVLSDDIERASHFYEGVLGLKVGARPPLEFPGYWLYAGVTACVHIAERASYRAHVQTLGLGVPERAHGPGPVDHIAFGASDYDSVSLRLERFGIKPVRNDVPGGGPRQLFFEDPDGVRVEINIMPPRTKAGGDG